MVSVGPILYEPMNEFIPEDPLLTPPRVMSLGVAIIYMVLAWWSEGLNVTIKIGCFLLLPLACIWFPDVLASFTGWGLSRVAITKESPEGLVFYGGWFLLFLPVLAGFLGVLLG
jgi:hypothetical protein